MNSSILLRTASVLSLIFCGAHTYEAYDTAHTSDPGEAAVFMAMQSYRLEMMGAMRSHWDFYRGYSLLFSVTLLLLAVLLWQLAAAARSDAARIRPLLATLFLGCMGFTILGGLYFFFAPAAFSAAVAICIALAFNSARSG